jgi:hypothetical protein
VFSTANRARDVASDALCRDPPPPSRPLLAEGPWTASAVPPGPPRPAASSKAADLAGPGRLPSTMDPSSGSLPFRTASLPSVAAGSPPHARGDSPRTPRRYRREQATTPLHPFARSKSPSARGRTAPEGCPSVRWGVGARPMPEGVDPAPLVDFCNQNSPRAQPLISRSPAGASKVALLTRLPGGVAMAALPGPALAGLPFERASGTGPLRAPRPRAGRVRASRASRPASRSLGPSGLPGNTNRGFTGQRPSAVDG